MRIRRHAGTVAVAAADPASSSTRALRCGPGYDTVSRIGSPGPAFFRSFGSHPR